MNNKNVIASKEDIYLLKKDLMSAEKSLETKMADQFKWLVGIIITLFGLTITIMVLLRK